MNASGIVESRETKLPIFHFASDTLRDFSVDLSNDVFEAGNERPSLIGIQLLSYYVMTISFSKNEFRLKSLGTIQSLTKTSKKPDEGISFGFAEDGGVFILSVTPASIAAKAGLRVFQKRGCPNLTVFYRLARTAPKILHKISSSER